ncbi:MAG: AMP-binding protein [Gammaproteobacteria bacterium]
MTMPQLLSANAASHGEETALREKDYGIWNAITWREYENKTRALALALAGYDIGAGDVVVLMGRNGPYWLYGALAAHANRALSLGIYGDVMPDEAHFQLDRTQAKAAVVEDEEQADKLLSLGSKASMLRAIVYKDPRGMRKYNDARLLSLDDALRRGEETHRQNPQQYAKMLAAGNGEESALLISTSGTTARPKFAEISHRAFLRHIQRYLQADKKTAADDYVSALPLPWVMETKYVLGKSLLARMKINFPENADTLMSDFREIGPTFTLLAPRVWEQIAGDVRARMLESTPLKRFIYNRGIAMGLRALRKGRRSMLAELLVFRPLRDSLGFSRLTSAATGGAALGPDTYRFFVSMGVPLKQIYGQTELLGAYTVHRPGEVDYESSGVAFDGVEIKIADADDEGLGRILTRHDNMMRGYYRAPEETAAAFVDGWMETGDAGYIKDNGHLVVIDRFADLAETSGGARFSPQYLENKLKFSPYIAEAVVIGDKKPHLAALVCLRFSVAAKWAERKRIAFTNYADLAARPEMRDLLAAEVAAANETLPPAQRLQKFVLLHKELDADDGELTRSKKVRRAVVGERYENIINAVYAGKATTDIDADITLQDGGKQRVRRTLHITAPKGE